MIIDDDILSAAGNEYARKKQIMDGAKAFEAGARWAEKRMMRFVPWDYNMPEETKNYPIAPSDMYFGLNPKDLMWDTFRAAGHSLMKAEACVRLTHLPSGTVIEEGESLSQYRNREKALERLSVELAKKQDK